MAVEIQNQNYNLNGLLFLLESPNSKGETTLVFANVSSILFDCFVSNKNLFFFLFLPSFFTLQNLSYGIDSANV
jgi:hypothetical protein